jgi:hypothetical protein
MQVQLVRRAAPLQPCAVVAQGDIARRLAQRMCSADDVVLHRLRVIVAHGRVIILGVDSDLPWVDGVSYLGIDPDAPTLRMPTTLAPSVASDIFERAIQQRIKGQPVVALLPDPLRIMSLDGASRWTRGDWQTWLQG